MDTIDLLARENEFKKLNKQLEKKTESLMKEIENAMQKQDIFSEFSTNLTLSPIHKQTRKHCCNTPKVSTPEKTMQNSLAKKEFPNKKKDTDKQENDIENSTDNVKTKHICNCCILGENKKSNGDLEFLYAFVSVNVKDNVLPQSLMKDNITVESVCKFLAAKVKLMQEQMDKLQSNINKKTKQCEAHMTQLAELESERMSLLNKTNTMRSETADVKAKYGVLQSKLNEKDSLYKEQRSATDKLTIQIKSIKCKNISLEARCASQEEVIAKLKQEIQVAKMAEKEFRDSTRNLSSSHINEINRLETKIKILTTCIEKQMSLIDNLRKQNALLYTDGALKALEKDYCDFLTQDL
ncbi:unnamed protein product, partial [Brenthis ino]